MRIPLLATLLAKARRALGWHYAFKSAATGKWVSEDYALANPDTTMKVRVPNPGKGAAK